MLIAYAVAQFGNEDDVFLVSFPSSVSSKKKNIYSYN